jgi:hypothetical protein
MLYDRWRQIANENRSRLALEQVANGNRLTFAELAAAAETSPPSGGDWAFPQGATVEFVLTVLRAWRDARLFVHWKLGRSSR